MLNKWTLLSYSIIIIQYDYIVKGYIFWPFLLPWGAGGVFLSKFKNREEFEGGLEKERKGGKEEKKKRVIKQTLKYLYEA